MNGNVGSFKRFWTLCTNTLCSIEILMLLFLLNNDDSVLWMEFKREGDQSNGDIITAVTALSLPAYKILSPHLKDPILKERGKVYAAREFYLSIVQQKNASLNRWAEFRPRLSNTYCLLQMLCFNCFLLFNVISGFTFEA